MLLNYIKLVNFRQYIGEVCIEFSTDSDKNVTIILGKNTSGKTTLVQAFNWVLYNQINFVTNKILNDDIEKRMEKGDTEVVSAEIGLNHNNIDYKIERSLTFECKSKGDVRAGSLSKKMSYTKIDGQTKIIDGFEIDSSINKILPVGLSSYFFFDGERISNISKKQDVSNSVKGLMGLDVLQSSRDHLIKVKDLLTKNLDLSGNEKAMNAKEKGDSQRAKLLLINDEIENADTQKQYYLDQKEQASIELRENAETSNIQREKEKLLKVKSGLESDHSEAIVDFVYRFNKNAFTYFGEPLIKASLNMLSSNNYVSESIKGMNSDSINQILNRHICICGTPIVAGSAEEKALIRELEFMPPKSIGTYVSEFKETANLYLSNTENYLDDINQKYKDVRRYKKEHSKVKDELDAVSKSLLHMKDTRVLEENYNSASKMLKNKEAELAELYSRKGICENEISIQQRIFDSLIKSNEKNAFINSCIDYTQHLYNWVDNSYTKKEEDIRSKLEFKVNSIFSKMYHGNRSVRIDKNYKVMYSDITTDESGGLETVKNFAFIAGLVDLAREKIAEKKDDDFDLGTEAYPLVMDAPFSKADEKHVSNIAKILPEIAEQVIMVVMEKDWTFAQEEMEDRVGKKYFIDKIDETRSKIVLMRE